MSYNSLHIVYRWLNKLVKTRHCIVNYRCQVMNWWIELIVQIWFDYVCWAIDESKWKEILQFVTKQNVIFKIWQTNKLLKGQNNFLQNFIMFFISKVQFQIIERNNYSNKHTFHQTCSIKTKIPQNHLRNVKTLKSRAMPKLYFIPNISNNKFLLISS